MYSWYPGSLGQEINETHGLHALKKQGFRLKATVLESDLPEEMRSFIINDQNTSHSGDSLATTSIAVVLRWDPFIEALKAETRDKLAEKDRDLLKTKKFLLEGTQDLIGGLHVTIHLYRQLRLDVARAEGVCV